MDRGPGWQPSAHLGPGSLEPHRSAGGQSSSARGCLTRGQPLGIWMVLGLSVLLQQLLDTLLCTGLLIRILLLL